MVIAKFSAEILEAALKYAARGWAVFPLRKNSKEPATLNGFYAATTDPEQIKCMFKEDREFNLGIRTGKESDLIVIDVDPKNGGYDSLGDLTEIHGNFEEKNYSFITPSEGYHIYFKYPNIPNVAIKNRTNVLPGIDVRADGGYVVACPSKIDYGRYYPFFEHEELKELPSWLLELIQNTRSTRQNININTILEGSRNDYLARMAGAMQRKGLSKEALLAALLEENQTKCNPPLPEREVEVICNSISRYIPEAPILPIQKESLIIRASEISSKGIESLRDKKKVYGTSTGIEGLDRLLGGGNRLGELNVLCASAKTGKSSFFHYLIHSFLKRGLPIGYAAREMSPEDEVLPNLWSIEFNESAWHSKITEEREKKYLNAAEGWPLYFSKGFGYFPIEEIRGWFYELCELGVKHFFIDHLHYLLQDPEQYGEAVLLAQEIKAITKEAKINVWLIVQPGKLLDGQELNINSLRGGAGISQALDNLFLLQRVKETSNTIKLTLDVARSKLGIPGSIYLQYDPVSTGFTEVELIQNQNEKGPIYDKN